ncbi:MAG: serine hydrolase, partial [Kordiimonadaceae bacterium]|nr:serine hydrolase [Kordiimonadaceae bacterium]
MRTSLKVALGGFGLLALASYASGIGPSYIRNAPAMLTGMGAMVTCTQHYVSGLSTAQAESDLQSYAAEFESIDLKYDDTARRVEASLFSVKTTSAQYRAGLGCALEVGDTSALRAAVMPVPPVGKDAFWPQGGRVPEANPSMQALLNKILKSDNSAGLQTRALLVVKNGVVMAEAYSEGLAPPSKLLGWSMSKSFNALLVGNLEMRGLLDPAHKPLFTEWAEDARAEISLDDMLHMASGLDLPEIYQPGTAVTAMLFTAHDSAEIGLDAQLVAAPGTRYQYSSGTANLLSQIIEDKVGGSFQHSLDNLHTEFVQPMGMQNFTYATDPSGLFLGSSFVTASARDWARIGQLM